MGEALSENRVARLTHLAGIRAGIRAQTGYKKKPGYYSKPSVVVDNTLDRRFAVDTPGRAWVTDITYIRTYILTHEGFADLCVVIYLF